MGGVAAEMSGGSFENGATTGAFSYLFNDAAHKGAMAAKTRFSIFSYDGGNVFEVYGEASGEWSNSLSYEGVPTASMALGSKDHVRIAVEPWLPGALAQVDVNPRDCFHGCSRVKLL